MKTTISVITVTFNAANLLLGLIDSLRLQTDRDFEWIVVDGALTDSTVEQMQRHVRSTVGRKRLWLPHVYTPQRSHFVACYKVWGIDY